VEPHTPGTGEVRRHDEFPRSGIRPVDRFFYTLKRVIIMLKNTAQKLRDVILLSAIGIGSAYAAVDAEVTTAQADAKTDALTIAAGALIIVIAIAGYKYMKRAA
jgi:hypothetical protein